MSSTISGARSILNLGKKVASSSRTSRTCSPANYQKTSSAIPNEIQTSSTFSTISSKEASTPTARSLQRRHSLPLCRSVTTLPTGGIVDDPERYRRFGLLKVFITMTAGLTVGAWISKNMAAFLEENELFVPEDDDDDDDDDDD